MTAHHSSQSKSREGRVTRVTQRAKRLTAKAVENARPSDTRREIPDAGCHGLYLIVQPVTGRKSWAVRYRYQGKPRKLTLDGFPSLADARQRCTAALRQLEQGIDPAEAKFEAKTLAAQADREKKRNTVEQLAQRFLAQHVSKLRPSSQGQVKHVFDDIVLPRWHGRPVGDIARRDVRELVEDVATATPIMANRALGWMSKFFAWLVERDVLAANPCAGIKRPAVEHSRDRVLDDGEIASLWKACEKVGGPGAACVQLMLLLGQRRGEIAGMKRAEIDGALWTIPAARMKGKEAHALPLPRAALAIIKAQPAFEGGDYALSFSGQRPFNAFSKLKARLDEHMRAKGGPWTLHDVRRSVASHLAGLGVPVAVVEKILAHRSGTFRGIVSVYQRHSFIPEMHAALEKWSERVEQLAKGTPPAKVIPLERRR
jgi:integrase